MRKESAVIVGVLIGIKSYLKERNKKAKGFQGKGTRKMVNK